MRYSMGDKDYPVPAEGNQPLRYRLPEERESKTVKFRIGGAFEGFFTVGLFSDGTPGEVFIDINKKDTQFAAFADQWCIAISLLFQLGFPHEQIYNKFKHQSFPPEGVTNLPDVPICKSLVDLIVRYLEVNFPPTKKEDQDDYDRMLDL